jgi:acyl-CoA thioester hydrolase
MTAYSKHLYVGWAHLDANGHMANSAYLDLVSDVRMFYFADHGFPPTEFGRLAVGPVIQRETLEYRRELRLLDPIEVTLAADGMSHDGARWVLVNEFIRSDGQVAARVTSTGGWLDLKARALIAPPPALADVMRATPRTATFRELSGIRQPSGS